MKNLEGKANPGDLRFATNFKHSGRKIAEELKKLKKLGIVQYITYKTHKSHFGYWQII